MQSEQQLPDCPDLQPFDSYKILDLDVLMCPETRTQDDLEQNEDEGWSRCDGCVFDSPVYEKPRNTKTMRYICQAASITLVRNNSYTGSEALCAALSCIWILPQQKEAYAAYIARKRMFGD